MPEDQPDTVAHTIDGDGTTPAEATVVTRDSEIAKTVRDDADSHACEGCGQTFEQIGKLLDHDCEEDWDGPDPDDDSPRALADGGQVERMEDADPRISAEQAYVRSPQVRKDILAEIVRLNEERDTVRYSDVREAAEHQSVRALAFETFLQHATILAMEDLIERGAFHETQTTVKPTEAAVEIVGDRDE